MRKLPVYFLIDVSESMAGEPIAEVEKGMASIIRELRNDPYALETVFIGLIVFAGKAEQLVPLTELTQFQPPSLSIGRGTSLGLGLNQLMNAIDRDVRKTTKDIKGDWKPIIFLFTDGAPTDDPEKYVEKWRKSYMNKCNLVVITFGENSDVPLLERLGGQVLTLKDTSPQAFREFFKWVSASLQASSMAVSDTGRDGIQLAGSCINLEKAAPVANTDENYVLLTIRCTNTKQLFLAKYDARGKIPYPLIGAYGVEEEVYNRLSGNEESRHSVDVKNLGDAPKCPCCKKSDGFAHCGKCGKLFCVGDKIEFTCPWCGNSGRLVYNESFNVDRSLG